MGYMVGGNVLARGFTILRLVIKENVRAESPEEFALISSTKEKRLIDADIPCAQCVDNALVGGAPRTVISAERIGDASAG